MINKKYYIRWSLFCFIIIAAIVFALTRPAPTEWLLENFRFLKFVDDYARVEPVIYRWSHSTPSVEDLVAFQDSIAKKPFPYLTEFGLKSFLEKYSPAVIQEHIERVKTILLAPCSIKLKKRALADPLQVADLMRSTLSPALTSSCPAIYVCTFGDTKEEAMQNAEAALRQLSSLKNENKIGEVQSICSFLCSQEQQALRLAEVTKTLNAFKWLANFKQAVIKEDLDIELFSVFLARMDQMKAGAAKPVSVSVQLNKLHNSGLKSLERFFFFKNRDGYLCVQRALVPPNEEQDEIKEIVERKLNDNFIDAVIVSPQLLNEKYYSLLQFLIAAVAVLWVAGIIISLLIISIRKAVARAILGSDADFYVLNCFINEDFKDYFHNLGIKKCTDFIDVEKALARNSDKNFTYEIKEKRVHRILRGKLFRRIDIITFTNEKNDKNIFFLKRGSGPYAKVLKNEYKAYQVMGKAGVPVANLAAYGEILREGIKTTFLITRQLDGFISLDDWQIQLAKKSSDFHTEKMKKNFLLEIAKIMSLCHLSHIYNFGWAVKHIFLKELDNDSIQIKLIDLKRSILPRIKARLLPFWALDRKIDDLTAFNTQLYLNIFSLKNRIFAFDKYAQNFFKRKNKKNKIIRSVIKHSINHGYFQYKIKKNKIFVNPEMPEQIAQLGNLTFDEIMRLNGEKLVTKKNVRTVVTINMNNETWFLKRHFKTPVKDSLAQLMKFSNPISNAKQEWLAIQTLTAIGIPNVKAISMGEKFKHKYFEKSSFIITQELKNGRSLEKILEQKPKLSFDNKLRLIRKVGALARKMHKAGLVHKDFYLGHIYVVGDLEGEYKLHLIDLQRVKFGAKIYNRWSVKDISALLFSANAIPYITTTDKMRFLFAYLNIKTLDRKTKYFIYKILAKNDKITKHTVKLLEKRRKAGELPAVSN